MEQPALTDGRLAPPTGSRHLLRWIRIWLVVMIAGLVVSGVTAFPLDVELAFGAEVLQRLGAADWAPGVVEWVQRVDEALRESYRAHPFLAYGTDWLAFAHLVIAAAFIGPYRDPVRNVWVTQWGVLACLGVVPLALIARSIRGIPLGWQLIDISFGVIGIVPLLIVLRLTRRLELIQAATSAASSPMSVNTSPAPAADRAAGSVRVGPSGAKP